MSTEEILQNQWEIEFEKYILPYYTDSGQILDKDTNYKEYMNTFLNKKVQFVYYKSLKWFDSLKYARGKNWLKIPYVNSLAETDMSFLKALAEPLCHRRVRQTIELCCELYNKEPAMFPVKLDYDRLHPGNTLIHSLKILERGCKIIRVSNFEYYDKGKIIKDLKSIADIQQIYQNKKIYAFFCNKKKRYGLQVLAPHGNFTTFDQNGNLQWKSDLKDWPFELFLEELNNRTKDVKNSRKFRFTYNNKEYLLNIPQEKKLRKEIFLNTIQWGNENIKF